MKKIFLILILCAGLAGCGAGDYLRKVFSRPNRTGFGSPADVHQRQYLQSGFDVSKMGCCKEQ